MTHDTYIVTSKDPFLLIKNNSDNKCSLTYSLKPSKLGKCLWTGGVAHSRVLA